MKRINISNKLPSSIQYKVESLNRSGLNRYYNVVVTFLCKGSTITKNLYCTVLKNNSSISVHLQHFQALETGLRKYFGLKARRSRKHTFAEINN